MQKAKLTAIQAQFYNLSRAPEEEQGIRMRETGCPLTVLLPVYEIKWLNKVLHASEPSSWRLRLEHQESQVNL